MKKSFVFSNKPIMTVMVKHIGTPKDAVAEIKRGLEAGAEGFGLQLEELPREYHTVENLSRIFSATEDKPVYVTNYKLHCNKDMSYEDIAEELQLYIDCGATLADVIGDMFCKDENEMTYDKTAIQKQMQLIDRIHEKGGEVIMSSHVNKYMTPEQVFKIAEEHKKRGADISKIVAYGNTMTEQMENLKITLMLKERLGIPFLFLSGGQSLIHRRLGILLGCCMSLCVCEEIEGITDNPQPLLSEQRLIRDEFHFV